MVTLKFLNKPRHVLAREHSSANSPESAIGPLQASTARPCVFGAGKLYWSASRTVACPSGREPTFLLAQGLALGRAVCERGL